MVTKVVFFVFVFSCQNLCLSTSLKEEIIVKTSVGTFRGIKELPEIDNTNKSVNSFKGIRYGVAPVGELRFKKPFPYKAPNSETLNATKLGPACFQAWHRVWESEDCLFLNVWAPKREIACHVLHSRRRSLERDILECWHGFEFLFGRLAMSAFGDVVVVTANYRLNAFGFLYGGSEDEPGNLGLFGQLLALKWLRDNIEAFGGDSKQVTIFGQGAGSLSVSALLISPLAKGLFQQAISQSGSIYLVDSVLKNASEAKQVSLEFAKELGCLNDNQQAAHDDVMRCMRSRNPYEIRTAAEFSSVNYLTYGTEFIPASPKELVDNGEFNPDINILFGVNDDEGARFIEYFFPEGPFTPYNLQPFTFEDGKKYITKIHSLFNHNPDTLYDALGYYLQKINRNDSYAVRKAVSQALGDSYVVCPTILLGQTMAKRMPNNTAYSYRLTRTMDYIRPYIRCGGWMGVCHFEEIPSVFGWPLRDEEGADFTEYDKAFSRDLVSAWTTFAKTGRMPPLGGWDWEPALYNGAVQYMELDYKLYWIERNRYNRICNQIYA